MAEKRRNSALRTLLLLSAIAAMTISFIPSALAPPPDACNPWPACRDGGGGGGGETVTYQFTATIEGEYTDLTDGLQTFIATISGGARTQAKITDLSAPSVRVATAPDYHGPARSWTSPSDEVQLGDYEYSSLAADFGGFVYSNTHESSSGNKLQTSKPLETLKVGQTMVVEAFDIFVTEARSWNGALGAVHYSFFLRSHGKAFGTVTRMSDTQWDFVFSATVPGGTTASGSGYVFQRYPWSDYASRTVDWENRVLLNPTVTFTGTGTIAATSA